MKSVGLQFNKLSNRWYAQLDNWDGDFEELEMVLGADDMLDRLSNGNDYVKCNIFADYVPGNYNVHLTKYDEDDSGAYYTQNVYPEIESVFICNVTKFVLGYFPNDIYLTKIF